MSLENDSAISCLNMGREKLHSIYGVHRIYAPGSPTQYRFFAGGIVVRPLDARFVRSGIYWMHHANRDRGLEPEQSGDRLA